MDRNEKEKEVASLSEMFGGASIAVCADYRGLSVAEMTDLRKQLRESGSTTRVVKNTLVRRSIQEMLKDAEEAERERFLEMFTGPSIVIFGTEDPIGPVKVLAKFAKDKEQFSLKGGWFEGAAIDESTVNELSKLPGREELLSKLLSLISAPATRLLQTVNAPAGELVRLLAAWKAKKETTEE